MRIALVTDWFAPRRGGIEAQLVQLASGLSARGHSVDVITSTPGESRGAGYGVKRLDTLLLPGVHLAISPAIVGLLESELRDGYDVVHAHVSVVSPVGYAGAGVARSLALPTVATFHSVLLHKVRLLRLADAMAHGRLSASRTVWTAVSELVAGQVRDALPAADVTVLPNGIDVAFWRGARSASATRAAHVVLVSTMRLHRKKRPRQLVAAFAQAVRYAKTPALLRIVGDGPERPAIERDIRALGLDQGSSRAEVLGWFSAERLRDEYSAADAFVLASQRESFGIAALEAAVAGLPVIAMADAGCREFLDVEPHTICRDDAQLSQAIARFIDDAPSRPSPAAMERYDWSTVLAAHELAYERAIARASGVGAGVA